MSERSTRSRELVHPRTGELLFDPKLATTDVLAVAHDELLVDERDVRAARRVVDDELIERLDHEGKRSVTLDGFRLSASPPLEKVWDMALLRLTLENFADEGIISRRKAEACVKLEPKPVLRELANLLSDPRTRERLEKCYREEPASRYLRVERT